MKMRAENHADWRTVATQEDILCMLYSENLEIFRVSQPIIISIFKREIFSVTQLVYCTTDLFCRVAITNTEV